MLMVVVVVVVVVMVVVMLPRMLIYLGNDYGGKDSMRQQGVLCAILPHRTTQQLDS